MGIYSVGTWAWIFNIFCQTGSLFPAKNAALLLERALSDVVPLRSRHRHHLSLVDGLQLGSFSDAKGGSFLPEQFHVECIIGSGSGHSRRVGGYLWVSAADGEPFAFVAVSERIVGVGSG